MAIADDFRAIKARLEELHPPQYDFSCHVCGVQCDTAPADPAVRAVCPAHCPGHDYIHDAYTGWYCEHCSEQAPHDYGDIDD